MNLKTISWKIEDGIGHLVLHQPPENIMNRDFFDEMVQITRDVLPRAFFKAMVIYGQGRHFSAGADPEELTLRIGENLPKSYPGELPAFLRKNIESFSYFDQLQVPTFAAIRGTCLGSALELALTCKYRICGDGTVLGFPESSFGLMPGCGGSVKLPAIVGRARAMELLLTGRNFSPEEAYQWGVVQKIVPRKSVIEEAVNLAKQYNKIP